MALATAKKVVTLLNPTLPDGTVLSAEECCWGPGEFVTYSSPMGGIASDLARNGWTVLHAFSVTNASRLSDVFLMPLVVGYERWLSGIANLVKSRCKDSKIVGIATPQGLAEVTEYRSSFDFVAGRNPVESVLRWLGEPCSGYFPVVHSASVAPWADQIVWLLVGSGCPFRCVYCPWSGQPVKWRSPTNTLQSLSTFYGNETVGLRRPYLICAEMNLDLRWLREFAELKLKSPLKDATFVTDVRADQCGDEVVALLKQAGCVEVTASLETVDASILDAVGRGMSVSRWLDGHNRFREAGISVQVPFLFNLSDDEDPEAAAKFVLEHDIDARPGIAKAYPGTPLWQELKEWDFHSDLPGPAEPVRTRKGVLGALARLRRFEQLVEEGRPSGPP